MNKEKLDAIFKAYDIRGIYKENFDEETAKKTAAATAKHLNAEKLIVAMDARDSSPALKKAVIEGISSQGVKVIDIGLSTTPMFYWAVSSENADGGLIVTASHNPKEYNGLKIVGKKSSPIGEESGLSEIKKMLLNDDFTENSPAEIEKKDLIEKYVDFLSQDISDLSGIKIAADFSCGASSMIVEKLSKKLNINITTLCSMGEEEKHEGNPLKDENTKDLREKLSEENFNLGVAFDTDADRIFFFKANGEKIDSGIIASIIAENILKENKNESFLGSVNISKIFKESVEENNGSYKEGRVGHVFMKQNMRENDAVFGAELSGHFYFRDFFYADAAIFTFVYMLKILKSSQKNISELTKKYEKYFRSGEVNFKVKDKKEAMQKIENLFSDGEISHKDGVSIRLEDFWINVRPSNTEPLLRVNLEADSPEILKKEMKKINDLLS